jgi:hypothetical protein
MIEIIKILGGVMMSELKKRIGAGVVFIVVLMLFCAGAVMAEYTYTDDFESYTLDDPLNGLGGWTVTLPLLEGEPAYWENVNNTSTAGSGESGNGKSAWAVVPPYGNNGITSRTITVDEDYLTVSWLYLPNSNGETISTPWGSGSFQLRDDTGNVYSQAWYRTDNDMYVLNAAGTGWIATGFFPAPISDPNGVAFIYEVQVDFAASQQKVSVTVISTNAKLSTPWLPLTGGARTLAEADGGELYISGGYRGIDDVLIATGADGFPDPLDDYDYTANFRTDFEDYTKGPLDGQDGWRATYPAGGYKNQVVDDTDGGAVPVGNGERWAFGLSVPYQHCETSRKVIVDDKYLTAEFLFLPNDNGEPTSTPWGSCHFQLTTPVDATPTDANDVYSDVWYRTDTPMYLLNAAGDGWTFLDQNPGEVPFIYEVEVDYALGQQRISTTIVSTGIKTTSDWLPLTNFGLSAPTIADANEGDFKILAGYAGIDDVRIACFGDGGPVPFDCEEVIAFGHTLGGDAALPHDCMVDLKDFGTVAGDFGGCTIPFDDDCVDGSVIEPTGTIARGTAVVDADLSEWTVAEWIPIDKDIYGNPDDVTEAKIAFRWDEDKDMVYAAVVLTDPCQNFSDTYDSLWDASDRIEIFSQGDPCAGDPDPCSPFQQEVMQQYFFGSKIAADGTSWISWPNGFPIVSDPNIETAVAIDGDTITYELGIKMFDLFCGRLGGCSNSSRIVSDLTVGDFIRVDVVIDTRWGTGTDESGVLATTLLENRSGDASSIAMYELVETIPCGARGYLDGDIFRDCVVDLKDVNILAQDWLVCNDPEDDNCIANW